MRSEEENSRPGDIHCNPRRQPETGTLLGALETSRILKVFRNCALQLGNLWEVPVLDPRSLLLQNKCDGFLPASLLVGLRLGSSSSLVFIKCLLYAK
jgi:hypothetical protein